MKSVLSEIGIKIQKERLLAEDGNHTKNWPSIERPYLMKDPETDVILKTDEIH